MSIILPEEEIIKNNGEVFYLQCKPRQDIIIRCKEDINSEEAIKELKDHEPQLDANENIVWSLERGKSGEIINGEVVINNEYDLDAIYLKTSKCWRITITIDRTRRKDGSCAIKPLKLSIPLIVNKAKKVDFNIQFACHNCQSCIESMLAIDLGNTRTCMLLCDDIQNVSRTSGIQLHKVPLISYTDNKVSDEGVFDSFVSFSEASGISFTRLGKEAIPVSNNLRASRASGDFYLSSPKRYYWDDDENLNGWKAWTNKNKATSIEKLPAARKLAKYFPQTTASAMPRSSVLAGMFLEILEQVESYINNPHFYSVSKLPKLLTHVCVTFPAGWSSAEQKKYTKVLENALKFYMEERCSDKKITLDVSCDEASAVLLCYIYGEIAKYSGRVDCWLEAIGRTDSYSNTTNTRIAVIDVGGGTSDLAIVNLQNTQKQTGGCQLQMTKLYKDGSNKAGDLMLREVVKRILQPRVAAELIPTNIKAEIRTEFIKNFGSFLNGLSNNPQVKQLSRRFWFPLAINFLQAVSSGTEEIKLPDGVSALRNILINNAPDSIKNNMDKTASTDISIKIEKEDEDNVHKIITKTFRDTAKLFGAAIYAFDADVVILSGKTTENSEVKEIFQKYCYLPKNRFIPMWNYMIGDWCSVSEAGKISDSKYTTAIGAALYTIINQHYPIQSIDAMIETKNIAEINEGRCFWGIANNGNFENAIMSPKCSDCWVTFSGQPKLLARRRFDVDISETAISYELRMKSLKQQMNDWDERIKRGQSVMEKEFDITINDKSIVLTDFLLVRKNDKELKSEKIKVSLGYDYTDDSKTSVVVLDASGVYQDGTNVSLADIVLYRKPYERRLQDSISVQLHMDCDINGNAKITITDVNGKYHDGSKVLPEDMELRIKTTADEGLFWLDSGRI